MAAPLTVILPTLNEVGNIGGLIKEIRALFTSVEIIVVDDGSTDGTREIVETVAREQREVRLIKRNGRPCLTKSIAAGVSEATTEFVAWMDADFSHPPVLLPRLLDIAKMCGCCIATRYTNEVRRHNNAREHGNVPGTVLSLFLNLLVHRILHLQITDYTSGFIVCRTDLIKTHQFRGDYGEYFIELMYFLERSGITIREIPFVSPPRKSGESKTGTRPLKLIRRGVRYILLTTRLLLPPDLFGKLSYARVGSVGNRQVSVTIEKMDVRDVPAVVSIHRTALGTTVNARAGKRFLSFLYTTFLTEDKNAVAWVMRDALHGIVGFCTATRSLAATRRCITRNMRAVEWIRLFRTLMLNPSQLLSAFSKGAFSNRVEKAHGEQYPTILTLAVRPDFQGRGFGTGLLEHCCEYFRTLTLDALYVDTESGNIRARKFYERNRFFQVGRNSADIILKRKLT